jgi:hypothetical protein
MTKIFSYAQKETRRKLAHLEITEEGIHDKIQHDERGKNSVQNPHEYETPSESDRKPFSRGRASQKSQ